MNLLRRRVQERGTVLIVVMALLAIMCVFMLCATHSIFLVKRELQRIEKQQLQRYEKPAASAVRK
jgi:Tfp pilus assembly protein PilX